MNDTLVDKVAEAVLYEGYILYPYRASSGKNRERFTFGRIYPQAYSARQNGAEPYVMQTQCLVRRNGEQARFGGRVRFLHAMAREVWTAGESAELVPELRIDGQIFQTWHEAVERSVTLPETDLDVRSERRVEFSFPESQTVEELRDGHGKLAGTVRRRQHELAGDIEIAAEPVDAEVTKITVRIANLTRMTEAESGDAGSVVLSVFASAHTILRGHDAGFLSLTDPPPLYAEVTATCENTGTWPVLVGEEEKRECDAMLSSPIILYDYPKIAPESPGDLRDGTEIDEILTLRVLTMTEDEKNEMRSVDAYARRILERTESLQQDDLMKMHGTVRDMNFGGGGFFDENTKLDHVRAGGVALRVGDSVRINPKSRADAMDMLLAGKTGVIEAIEQDAEGRVHLAIVLEDDPGRDLGMMRQPGHRFFYALEEVEPLKEGQGCAS